MLKEKGKAARVATGCGVFEDNDDVSQRGPRFPLAGRRRAIRLPRDSI